MVLAKHGDLAAFDALVGRYRPAALLIATQIVWGAEAAEDAVQDSLVAAFKSLPKLTDPERFAGWFGAILRHRCRRLARGERFTHLAIDDLILSHVPSLFEHVESRATTRAVQSALEELPEELRPVMNLYYLEGWKVGQIGEFLGLPATTVKWRLHSGRSALRATLAHLMEESNAGK